MNETPVIGLHRVLESRQHVFSPIDIDRVERAINALHEQVKTESMLRWLLAKTYSGAKLYHDDGEMSDSSAHPAIDFLRDAWEDIESKMLARLTARCTHSPKVVVTDALAAAVLDAYVKECIKHDDDAPSELRVEAMRTALEELGVKA